MAAVFVYNLTAQPNLFRDVFDGDEQDDPIICLKNIVVCRLRPNTVGEQKCVHMINRLNSNDHFNHLY